MLADPDGVDPDPTCKKKTDQDPYPTVKKKNPDGSGSPNLIRHPL